jgi:hypothetical protein
LCCLTAVTTTLCLLLASFTCTTRFHHHALSPSRFFVLQHHLSLPSHYLLQVKPVNLVFIFFKLSARSDDSSFSQILEQIAAGNLDVFKAKLCDEGQEVACVSAMPYWVTRFPPAMRLSFDDWAVKKVADMRACYVAFFLGSGCIDKRLVKMRRLVFGHVFSCCRSRLVAYLVPRAPARQRICALAASATEI